MRRKLIELDAFKEIEKGSLSQAEYELKEAEYALSEALNIGNLTFHCFNGDKVLYETDHGTFIHATYDLNENKIGFQDISELVVDSESQKKKLREYAANLLNAIIDGKETEANSQFQNYMEQFAKMHLNERAVVRVDNRSGKVVTWTGTDRKKRDAAKALWRKKRGHMISLRHDRENPVAKAMERKRHADNERKGMFTKVKQKTMKEWSLLSENVLNYAQKAENFCETEVQANTQGDVTTVTIPTAKVRNEGKILNLQYKTLKTDVKVLREAARGLAMNEDFCKVVAYLKRLNNMSMNKELTECLGDIVTKFPGVLYLTDQELAKVIGEALATAGQSNYDDQICAFMAEGILRTAQETYGDRIQRITQLANGNLTTEGDTYLQFQQIVQDFYPKLDESLGSEMQVYTDLYNTLVDVYNIALEAQEDWIRTEAATFLNELRLVVEGKSQPNLGLATEVASWLQDIVESNLPGASENWEVSNSAYVTDHGEHPQMEKLAKMPGHPGSYSGDWGDSVPVSDGKNYRGKEADEMRSHSWGNKGGKDVYPDLQNPVVPKAGEFGMRGEKNVAQDGDNALGQMQPNGDVWPELKNPYVKTVDNNVFKAKTDDLVVDK